MIRERIDQDLEPLCAVLAELDHPPGCVSDQDRARWLQSVEAEVSWVFDAAPVTVTPTRNVVGHVQIFAPTATEQALVEAAAAPPADVLVIGRLFVRASSSADGFRRFLLTESVRFIRDRGGVPVLDMAANPGLSQALCERRGFALVPSPDPAVVPMVHHEKRSR